MGEAYALVAILLALGKLASAFKLFEESGAEAINRFVILIALPAMVLKVLPGLQLGPELLKLALIPYACAAGVGALVWFISGALGFPRATRIALVALSVVGNTAFLGYPMVRALLGEDALPAALVFDQFGSFVLLAAAIPWLIALAQSDKPPPKLALLKRMLSFPPLVAVALALLLPAPSGMALALVDKLAATLVPLSCFAVGLKLKFRLQAADRGPLALGLAAKLLAFPLLAALVAKALGLDPKLAQVAVFQAAMPTMISAAAMLASAGLKPELGAALVGYGLLLSMLTLPFIAL